MLKGELLKQAVTQSMLGVDLNNIGPSSVDVTLDGTVFRESDIQSLVDLTVIPAHVPVVNRDLLSKNPYMEPNEFILGSIREWVNMPDNLSAMFSLRSCLAQSGLEQATSVWIRPGWQGYLVVELKNFLQFNRIKLAEGMKIGQLHFFECRDL